MRRLGGFETHKGCSSSCVYCLESNMPVSFKRLKTYREIKSLADVGVIIPSLWLWFNENNEYASDFCSALKKSGPASGGLSTWSRPISANRSSDYWKTVALTLLPYCRFMEEMSSLLEDYENLFWCKSYGIRTAVDFLTGFPYETEDNLMEYFDTLRRRFRTALG